MADTDPCRRSLTPIEEARLFSADAVTAAREVMAGSPAGRAGEAYLAVFAILAAAALGQGQDPPPPRQGLLPGI